MRKVVFIIFFIVIIFVAFVTLVNRRQEGTQEETKDAWQEIRQSDIAKTYGGWGSPVLVEPASTAGWEDGAYISSDGTTLYFVYINVDLFKLPEVVETGSKRDSKCKPACGNYPRIDTFFSQKDNSVNWDKVNPHPLTISYPVGGIVLANENKAYFHMEKEDGLKTEIYFSEKTGGNWQSPQKIASLSSVFRDDDPYVSPNDNELFFWSDRPGKGDNDIFYSKKINNQWQTPVLLSAPINTSSNDMQPFLQGNTLYFTSDRSGKAKIYQSERTGENQWSEPSVVIESSFVVGEPTLTQDGRFLYFVQIFKSPEGIYNSDIFYVEKK